MDDIGMVMAYRYRECEGVQGTEVRTINDFLKNEVMAIIHGMIGNTMVSPGRKDSTKTGWIYSLISGGIGMC